VGGGDARGGGDDARGSGDASGGDGAVLGSAGVHMGEGCADATAEVMTGEITEAAVGGMAAVVATGGRCDVMVAAPPPYAVAPTWQSLTTVLVGGWGGRAVAAAAVCGHVNVLCVVCGAILSVPSDVLEGASTAGGGGCRSVA